MQNLYILITCNRLKNINIHFKKILKRNLNVKHLRKACNYKKQFIITLFQEEGKKIQTKFILNYTLSEVA